MNDNPLPRPCLLNCVANGHEIMPQSSIALWVICDNTAHITGKIPFESRKTSPISGIIQSTLTLCSGGADEPKRSQTASLARARSTPSQAPGSPGSTISRQRLLRSQDLVQVKYEMLRCVRIDGRSASEAAKQFGFSRMAFYQALAAYRRAGLPGLIPSKRGPKRRHKLTDAVMNVIVEQRTADRACSAAALAEHVRQRLGIIIHRRSIERVLAGAAKKGRLPSSA